MAGRLKLEISINHLGFGKSNFESVFRDQLAVKDLKSEGMLISLKGIVTETRKFSILIGPQSLKADH